MPRLLVGRSPQADLRLPGTWISGEHVVIAWGGDDWRIRDLGSSNGTTLDGVPLTCRRDHALKAGARLAFGQADEQWVLEDDSEPVPVASGPGDRAVFASDGVISLPDDVAPIVSVHHDLGRWWLDRDGDEQAVGDRCAIAVGAHVWHLRLPEVPADTLAHVASRRLADFHLELGLSRDEETVEVRLLRVSHRIVLEARNHHYLMVLLARHALEERAAGMSPAEAGWLDPAELAEMLKISRQSLNVYIHRIRRQVQDAGIFDGKDIIQRMANTYALRLAPVEISVVPLSGDPPH